MLAPEHRPSDSELAARATGGDRDAFLAIYQRYHLGIYRFARSMTGQTTMAEDITQEVFLILLRELKRYNPGRAALGTYLYAIARNVSRHKLRRERRFVELDTSSAKEPGEARDSMQALIDSETAATVRRMVRGLSSRYREVLILCDLHELSYEQAAIILARPVGTVRSRLHRARRQLADRLRRAEGHLRVGQETRKCLT